MNPNLFSLYIHGGHDIREGTLSSLWRIDLSNKNYEWEQVHTRGGIKPGKIAYHSLTLYSDNKCILIGGSNLGIDNPNIYELDLDKLEWSLDKHSKPDDLISIDEHTACLDKDKLYVFGGNVHGFKSNKMYILDMSTRKWTIEEPENGPCERSGHSAVIKDGKMYVFGGKNSESNKLGDFWVYDTKAHTWSQLETSDLESPISRSGHSSGVYKNFIIIYAGIHELTQELSDMCLYDISRNCWMTLFDEEHSPVHQQNRSVHSSFSNSGNDFSPYKFSKEDEPKE